MAQPSDYTRHPMGSIVKNSESETIARNIMVILMQNGNVFRKMEFDEYLEARKSHGASEREVMREKPYFDKVVEHCSSEESADKFCEDWKKTN